MNYFSLVQNIFNKLKILIIFHTAIQHQIKVAGSRIVEKYDNLFFFFLQSYFLSFFLSAFTMFSKICDLHSIHFRV